VEHRRDRAEAEAFADGVERAEQRRATRVDDDEDAEQERAEAGQPEPARDRARRVGIAVAEIDSHRLRGGRPSPRTAGDEYDEQQQGLEADAPDRERTSGGWREVSLDALFAERQSRRATSPWSRL